MSTDKSTKDLDQGDNFFEVAKEFYDLTSDTIESEWGESIHLTTIWKGETLRESMKRHEHFFALQLGLRPGQKILDVGCGIGGPAMEIARFSYVSITGINISEHQINRAKALTRNAGLENSCDFVTADFMNIPFPENSFDAVYSIEATCHAKDLVACYKEIFRVLKPGQLFAVDEWCMTDVYDPNNQEHQKMKADVERYFGFSNMRVKSQCLEDLKTAGFEVVWERDCAQDSPIPWYAPFDKSHNSPWAAIINTIKAIGKGRSQKAKDRMDKCNAAIFAAGKIEILTPKYFMLGRKPFDA